jgi:import receptor subunit TOM22
MYLGYLYDRTAEDDAQTETFGQGILETGHVGDIQVVDEGGVALLTNDGYSRSTEKGWQVVCNGRHCTNATSQLLPYFSFITSTFKMVLVEEVPEDVLLSGERDSDFETDSEASDDGFDPNETIYERVVALKDIVPPTTRVQAAERLEQTKSWVYWSLQKAGSVAWIVSTSALLVGLPLALAIEDEARIAQQEKEMQMQTQGQQQVCGMLIELMLDDWPTAGCLAPRILIYSRSLSCGGSQTPLR